MRHVFLNVTRMSLLALPMLASLTTGCDHAKTALGYDRKNPDAYRVVDRAPLCVPPDFALRPPRPGAPRPQEKSAQDLAQEALMEKDVQREGDDRSVTKSEQELLSHVSSGDPHIRETLDEEYRLQKTQKMPPLAKKLGLKELDEENVINPVEESARLNQQKKS